MSASTGCTRRLAARRRSRRRSRNQAVVRTTCRSGGSWIRARAGVRHRGTRRSKLCPPNPVDHSKTSACLLGWTLRLLFPWPGGPEQQERVRSWAWTLGYSLLAGAERLFALTSRDFEAQFEGMRTRPGPGGDPVQEGILTFIDPNLGGSGYLERFAQRLPEVAAASLHHLDHEGCEAACYRCLKSYDNQRNHDFLKWPLAVSTLEGLRQEAPTPVPLNAVDVNDPRPWRAAFEAGVASPLEHRC